MNRQLLDRTLAVIQASILHFPQITNLMPKFSEEPTGPIPHCRHTYGTGVKCSAEWHVQTNRPFCMHPFAMETAAILVHSLNRFSLCTKLAAVAVAKLLLCCDIICKCSIREGYGVMCVTGSRSRLASVR